MRGIYLKDNNNNKCLVAPYYRVGDLFLTTNATNPSNYLGGTWELFGPGRVLVCVDTSNSNFNTVKKTGGAATHTHTQGVTGAASGNTGSTAISVNQMPSHAHGGSTNTDGHHRHEIAYYSAGAGAPSNNDFITNSGMGWSTNWKLNEWLTYAGNNKSAHSHGFTTNSTGGGKGHTHTLNSHTHTNPTTAAASSLQPFITCYVWIRTA